MRITVNVADVWVELEDEASTPTVEGVETLLARAVGAALNAYAGLVEIDGLEVEDDEDETVGPEDE